MAGPASSSPERNWLETSPASSDRAAGDRPPAVDRDREVAGLTELVDLHAEGPEAPMDSAHRPGQRAPGGR